MVSSWSVSGRGVGLGGSFVPIHSFTPWYIITNILLVTSLLNVMSMYHDTLLARIVKANPSYRALIPPSLHSRFTRAWSNKDKVYRWAARVLEIIRFTELVLEMILRRKVSEKTKWRLILLLEIIKYLYFCVYNFVITKYHLIEPPFVCCY